MLDDRSSLVLFDVDGTLIHTEGPSRHSRAFRAAFLETYGSECRFSTAMHGMTDLQIVMTLAAQMGLGNGRVRELALQACQSMVDIYQQPEEGDGRYVALPGAQATVEMLARRGVPLGLVTGNAPEIARDKLTSVGLMDYFSVGAFGTESENRSALPPLAIARAEALLGRTIRPRRVFVVGDTPRDVVCALDNGCRAIAVTTGSFSAADLVAAGAELVLPSLLAGDMLLPLMK